MLIINDFSRKCGGGGWTTIDVYILEDKLMSIY